MMAHRSRLTGAQREAISYVESQALRLRSQAGAALREAMERNSVSSEDYRAAMERLRSEARVAVSFHPDRVTRGGRSVAAGLLADGRYRNQFETGVSSGSTSGFAGGRRDEWERSLFGGRYHGEGTSWEARPKYGALHLINHPDGPCPRFGSCYFVLRPEVSSRCTFTPLGSQGDRAAQQSGTLGVFEPVLLALAGHLESVASPLGCEGLGLAELISRMGGTLPFLPADGSPEKMGRALDSFVEAQVHGPVELDGDVEELVADVSFRENEAEGALTKLAATYGIPLRWHPGFCLRAEEFPEEFRGFWTRRVAERVAVAGVVDAASLGAGENDYTLNPEAWQGFDSTSETLTMFRRVWHVLVLHGRASAKWQEVEQS